MPASSFRLRLQQAVGAFAAFIVALASFAYFGAQEIDGAALRSRNAQATLAAHITIASGALNLFKQISDAALLNEMVREDWEKRHLETVRRDVAIARRSIAEEVKELGDREDETEELERLSLIEREIEAIVTEYNRIAAAWMDVTPSERRLRIAALLDTRIDVTFNNLVSAAIAEERREVAEADARLAAVTSRMQMSAVAIALTAAPLIAFVVFYLNQTLLGSLRALSQGAEAFARGDFGYPMRPLKSAEFEFIRRRLSHMASELNSNRERLHAANERLEAGIAAKTAELADANRRLEEADASRRRFFADVSHELRTPLTVIRGEAEIALRGGDRRASDYRESLGRIADQAVQMGRLVDDLLFIARADAGEPRMEMRSIAIDVLVSEVLASFKTAGAARGLRLRKVEADKGAVVVGDRGRLAQVLGVLVDNAIQYSSEGGEIRLSARVEDNRAVIIVEDDGIGIPQPEVERVFERFYRADNARALGGAGVGLGLPVAKAIIEAHKGLIRLSASSTGGVRATVDLPVETKLRAIS